MVGCSALQDAHAYEVIPGLTLLTESFCALASQNPGRRIHVRSGKMFIGARTILMFA